MGFSMSFSKTSSRSCDQDQRRQDGHLPVWASVTALLISITIVPSSTKHAGAKITQRSQLQELGLSPPLVGSHPAFERRRIYSPVGDADLPISDHIVTSRSSRIVVEIGNS